MVKLLTDVDTISNTGGDAASCASNTFMFKVLYNKQHEILRENFMLSQVNVKGDQSEKHGK